MIRWLFIVGVALLAGAATSSADIIFESAGFYLGTKWEAEIFNLDVNGDNISDFQLTGGGLSGSFAGLRNMSVNRYLIRPDPPPNIGGSVIALNSGYLIGDTTDGVPEEWFGLNTDWGTLIRILNTGSSGEFYHHRGFIGLEFETNDETYYGWLDVEGVQPSFEQPELNHVSLYIHGWAYETEPDKGIISGAVPEPSSMILFIVGFAGIWSIRKRKKS